VTGGGKGGVLWWDATPYRLANIFLNRLHDFWRHLTGEIHVSVSITVSTYDYKTHLRSTSCGYVVTLSWYLNLLSFGTSKDVRHLQSLIDTSVGFVLAGAVGWGTVLKTGRSQVRFPDQVIGIFHGPDHSDRTMALGPITRDICWRVKAAGA